jgi:hypothetical protein
MPALQDLRQAAVEALPAWGQRTALHGGPVIGLFRPGRNHGSFIPLIVMDNVFPQTLRRDETAPAACLAAVIE